MRWTQRHHLKKNNFPSWKIHWCCVIEKRGGKFMSQIWTRRIRRLRAAARRSSRMPGAVLLWAAARRWPRRRSKEAFDETSWYPFTLFSRRHLLKGAFHHFPVFPKAPLRAPRNKKAEFRNACLPATHRHRKDARTHSHAHADDSCISAAWRRLITASFVMVT